MFIAPLITKIYFTCILYTQTNTLNIHLNGSSPFEILPLYKHPSLLSAEHSLNCCVIITVAVSILLLAKPADGNCDYKTRALFNH